MYTDIQQETLDISWFFTDNEDLGFVASGGGKLPASVTQSANNNELIGFFFKSLPASSNIVINPNLNNIISSSADERYLAYFINMAEKGLFAFDKTVSNRFSNPQYHLVAGPVTPLKFADLPFKIKDIISQTKLNGEIGMELDISLIT